MRSVRFRVATLNAWGLPQPFAKRVPQRMRAIGSQLAHLDLDAVAFQEVWTGEARRLLVRAGRGAGLGHVWHNEATFGGSGLLVMSRAPIQAVHFERFVLPGTPSRPDHPDYYGGKGFVRLRLQTGAGPVALVDTHLQARYRSDVEHEYIGHRVGQIVQMATHLLATPEPLIVVGDFNFEQSMPEFRVLTGVTGLRDSAAELERFDATVLGSNPYRSARRPDKRIDYVFVRDGEGTGVVSRRVERILDETLDLDGRPGSYSDHAGVLAELELRPGAAAPIAPVDPASVRLASHLLVQGRDRAARVRDESRWLAGAGLGAAALAGGAGRNARVSRRRLLRGALYGTALLTLGPSVGVSILSEVFVSDEVRAFDRLARRASQLASWTTASPGGAPQPVG